MTLQEAIAEVKRNSGNPEDWKWCGEEMAHETFSEYLCEAIATILNAVVKGELK